MKEHLHSVAWGEIISAAANAISFDPTLNEYDLSLQLRLVFSSVLTHWKSEALRNS